MGKIFSFLILTGAVIITGCSRDEALQTNELHLSGFKHVCQGPGVELHLKKSSGYRISAVGTAEQLKKLQAEVKDSTLTIRGEPPGIWDADYEPVKVYVETPLLNIIRNNGERCIYSDSVLDFPKLILKSEDVYGDLNIGNMQLEVSSYWLQVISNGISDIRITGETDILDLKYYNSIGIFDGRNLSASRVRIMHKGENTLTVNPSYYLRGDIYSLGDVIATRRPQITEVVIHDTGTLIFE